MAEENTTPQPPPLEAQLTRSVNRRGSLPRDILAPSSSEEGVGGGVSAALAIRAAAEMLRATSDTPRLDAELLMAHALGVTRSDLLLRRMDAAAPPAFAALVARRLAHEPIAYIVGHAEFYGIALRVSPAVLIPRADSETLVSAAIADRPDVRRVLDCGTGSGALLLAVLSELPEARGIGIDRSADALAVAQANAARLGLDARASMVTADWDRPETMAPLGMFDLVLTNPPYVEADADLAPSVRAHEPAGALFAGADGLDAYRVLIPQLPTLLAPGGGAFVEIGAAQEAMVRALAEAAGFAVRLHRDLGGRPRVLALTRNLAGVSRST